jgi:excisionase family DNA binding protein
VLTQQQTPPAVEPVLLKRTLAFQALGIGETLGNAEIRAGRLRTVKIGRRRLVPREALDEYVAGLRAAEQ